MKLTTDIKPRADGGVSATTSDGRVYQFKPDADGRLVAEIKDDAHVEFLLDSGNFYPAEEQDTDAGIAALGQKDDPESDDTASDTENQKAGKKKSK